MRQLSLAVALVLPALLLPSVDGNASASVSVVINQLDVSRFPTTVGYVTALNSRGYPISGLQTNNFHVTEDGVHVTGLQVAGVVNVDEPLAAVLTIDVSGSMTEADINAEKAAAIAFVQGLRPQDQVAVVAFSTEVHRLTEFTTNREPVIGAIRGLQPGGNTALYDALFDSVDFTTSAQAPRRVVVLMTDGVNTASKAALDDGLNLAARQGTAVYTIGLGKNLDRNVLTLMAQKTGGTSLLAPSAQDLEQAYDRIATELRSQYLISYESPRPRGARDYHVSIRVTAEGAQAQAEATYRPASTPPVITSVSLKDGETISGPVTVQVEAASQVPIASVRLRVNGRLLGETASRPYWLSLDPARLSPGRHEVAVTVVDLAGSETTAWLSAVVPSEAAGSGVAPEPVAPAPPSMVEMPDVVSPVSRFAGQTARHLAGALGSVGSEGAGILPGIREAAAGTVSTFTSPVQVWAEAAMGIANDTTSGWWEAAQAATRNHGHRVPPAGLAFAAAIVGVLQIRKAFASLQTFFRRVPCEACGAAYRSYLSECPKCFEGKRQRELQQRGLEGILIQNNLVTKERLAEVTHASRASGRSLEELVLEQLLVSPEDLAKARYYLAQSLEIQTRVNDFQDSQPTGSSLILLGRILAFRAAAIAFAGAVCGLTLPGVFA